MAVTKPRCLNPSCENKVRTARYCAACKRVLRDMRAVLNPPPPQTMAEDAAARRAIHAGRAGGIRDLLPGVR